MSARWYTAALRPPPKFYFWRQALVVQLCRRRNIKNTLIYMQLVKFENEDDFVCKSAETVEEAKEIIERGFEYVCAFEDAKLFRKRK